MRKNQTTAIPSFKDIMRPALQALIESGGSASNQELLDRVVQIMGLSEEVQATLHLQGPYTEVGYRLAWAKTYLKAVGALDNSKRGIWSITATGRTLTDSEIAGIPAKVRGALHRRPKHEEELIEEAEEDVAHEGHWKDKLLALLKEMPAAGFERLAQRILRESGFVKVDVTGRSGDGGIDGVGVLRLTLISFQVFFQCKRYKDIVGPGVIRDFRGAMVGRTDKGLVITTGRFTPEATKEAGRDGAPPVELIDGDLLCDLLKTLNLGVKTELVEHVSIQEEFFASI
ncbi:MAG: restriction endonuclease [Deltaproteobacteria bacterium]|nr:restriction endonuclease [Deltaproteobacteria bacterium]